LADRLTINGTAKGFAGIAVLKGIDLTIEPGEFFTLLGPSGCGKTTLLRIIAGFLVADSGSITLGSERLDQKPAHQRDIGMVFQDYAVFPHLTVADNVGFGLKLRQVPKAELNARVDEALRMVQLDRLGARYPSELSGGQQQRVGIARAMVIRPRLLLMDEPLSNLDAKLRLELRDDIRQLQKKLGIATIYVTHDQEEALAISDRICVMNGGVAEQVGTPTEIYRQPRRRFAAAFVGTTNFIKAPVEGSRVALGGARLPLARAADGPAEIGIRPEHVRVMAASAGAAGMPALEGTVARFTYLGTHGLAVVATDHGEIIAQVHDLDGAAAREGAAVRVVLPVDRLMVFDAAGDRVEIVA
jgi:iron(III) transport system ATP-binding protein